MSERLEFIITWGAGSEYNAAIKARRKAQARAVFDAWDHRCAYCDAPATTLDHILPKARGGGRSKNLIPACQPCNTAKADKLICEFVTDEARLSRILHKAELPRALLRAAMGVEPLR